MIEDADTRRPTMTTGTDTATSFQELDHREGDGISVSLRWNPCDGSLAVAVVDSRTETCFEFAVAPGRALDAFRHPFAYAGSSDRSGGGSADPASIEEAVTELEQQTLAFL
jgi:hypothetical protein